MHGEGHSIAASTDGRYLGSGDRSLRHGSTPPQRSWIEAVGKRLDGCGLSCVRFVSENSLVLWREILIRIQAHDAMARARGLEAAVADVAVVAVFDWCSEAVGLQADAVSTMLVCGMGLTFSFRRPKHSAGLV